MYRTKSGEEIFIIDGHTHNWNAAKDNIKNIHGQQFIDCFYPGFAVVRQTAGISETSQWFTMDGIGTCA